VVGAVGRALSDSTPKWYKYGTNSTYYSHTKAEDRVLTAVIVEDVLSAITVANYFPVTGFGLLGTSLQQEHIHTLSDFDRVVVALDPDASQKALQHAKDLNNYVNEVKVIKLVDDLKYKNLDDFTKLKELLND